MPHRRNIPVLIVDGEEMTASNTAPRMPRNQACVYLREQHGIIRSPATLAKLASIGGGPTFQKAGRVPLYTPEDLNAWAESILSRKVRSSSELNASNTSNIRGVS